MARQTTPTQKTKIHPDNYADAILTADNHLSPRIPRCRNEEEFLTAMFKKLDFIANLQKRHGGIPVLSAGDITDRWFIDKGEQWFVTAIIKRMHNWIAIPGQHDLPQHSLELYDKSLLALLEEAGCIKVIMSNDVPELAGFPWGVEPTKVAPGGLAKCVALIHRMTYVGKPPYPGAENDGGTAKELMQKMKGFDLIVSGDNHETFMHKGAKQTGHIKDKEGNKWAGYDWDGSWLVNPGSMMRTSAKQIDHEPCVFLWYASTNTVERVVLPHQKDVVSREHLEAAEARDERLDAFVESLEGRIDLSVGFRENVMTRLRETEVSAETEAVVMEVLG